MIDSSKPADNDLISTWPPLLRETRGIAHEVVAARGSQPSLTARLSTALTPEGELKVPAPIAFWTPEENPLTRVSGEEILIHSTSDRTPDYPRGRALQVGEAAQWHVLSSTYDPLNDLTRIIVVGPTLPTVESLSYSIRPDQQQAIFSEDILFADGSSAVLTNPAGSDHIISDGELKSRILTNPAGSDKIISDGELISRILTNPIGSDKIISDGELKSRILTDPIGPDHIVSEGVLSRRAPRHVASFVALKTFGAGLFNGQQVDLLGFYLETPGSGGGSLFWDASRPKADHNGGTVIDPSHTATPGTEAWYTAENTGSGCWVRKASVRRCLSDWGCHLDGVLDSHYSLKAAFENGEPLKSPKNSIVRSSLPITILGIGVDIESLGSKIIFDGGGLEVKGSIGNYLPVTGGVAIGVKTINATTTFSEGDLFLLLDDTDFSFSNHRSYYKTSDILTVYSNTGTQLITKEQMTHNYPSGNDIKIAKLDLVTLKMSGIELESQSSGYALSTTFSTPSIKCDISGGGSLAALLIDTCYDFVFDGKVQSKNQDVGYGYGISVSQSKKGIIRGIFDSDRHSVAFGSSGRGICRDIVVEGAIITNHFETSGTYAADIHGSCYNIKYERCVISGGAVFSGQDCLYDDCTIIAPIGAYPIFNITEIRSGINRVKNSRLIIPQGSTVDIALIKATSSAFFSGMIDDYSVEVVDCTVDIQSASPPSAFVVMGSSGSAQATVRVNNVKFTGNTGGLSRLVQWHGSPLSPPNTIDVTGFNSANLPSDLTLVFLSSGSLAGAAIKTDIESYFGVFSMQAGDSIAAQSIPLRVIPTNIIVGPLGNLKAPLIASLRATEYNGSVLPFASAAYDSSGNSFTAVVTTGDATTIGADRTYYVDINVGGNFIV